MSDETDKIEYIMGIDLGTTNSCAGIRRDGNFVIAPDEYGSHTIPSIVSVMPHSRYIGIEAKNQIALNPVNTIYEVKRLIGKPYNDDMVQNDINLLTYNIIDVDNTIYIKTDYNVFAPEQISAMVLAKLKDNVNRHFKQYINKAVITVPAYFNDAQRQATKNAAEIAGIDCIRIINEPIASALAFGLHNRSKMEGDKETVVVVYDLGGGTLDVSLLVIAQGVFQVIASAGNTHLGGADFDEKLIKYCIQTFKDVYKITDLDIDLISLQKLKKSCEKAKCILSSYQSSRIFVNNFYNNIDLNIPLTREQFETICVELFVIALEPIHNVMEHSGYNIKDVDEILLVGGGTKMPLIKKNIKDYFNKSPNISLNPDEVVAIGASIQGWILNNINDPFASSVVLLDVLPLSLGIETMGGEMNIIIQRNSTIPITKTKAYTTDCDFETSVTIKIYEGERTFTKDNHYVGQFDFEDIEQAPRGVAQIDITFSIDTNGIVSVTALDRKNPNNEKRISVSSIKTGLTKEQIANMIATAQKMEKIDDENKEKKEYYYNIKDMCDIVIYNCNLESCMIEDSSKHIILKEINNIYDWIKEKSFDQRELNEYANLTCKLKKDYGTLILRPSTNTIKETITTNIEVGTSIYNEDDEIVDLDKIDGDDTKQLGIITKKDELVALCSNVSDVISSIDDPIVKAIRDYINDTMIWVYVKQNIKEDDIAKRIVYINTLCNKLVDDGCIKPSKKQELEQLCYSTLSFMACTFKHSEEINSYITEILEWLVDIDVNNKTVTDDEYNDKISYINDINRSLLTI